MPFHIDAQKYLLNIKKIINADAKDVPLGRKQQLYLNSSMKLLLTQLLAQNCPSNRDKSYLMEHILRRIIANMPVALYQYALTLVATGQCAAAMAYLNLAITRGHLPSRALMAYMLSGGREGVAKDHKRAFELVTRGYQMGCHHCQGVLAMCYMLGYGCVKADATRSLELAWVSSDKGSKYGQCVLGSLYRCGLGGVKKNSNKAVELFQIAAAQKLDWALCCLGEMIGNYGEALRLYQLAAAQGFSDALFSVGLCHEFGDSVPVDVEVARSWFQRAQAAGSQDAKWALQRLLYK